jgi:mediator of RNA polymerase II transcription subunit 13
LARPNESYCNSAAIYASFILSVAGAIGLQLIRRHNAIPLGNRTLFTAINRSEYGNPTIVNDDLDALPALTSLRVELNQAGKVIVSLHTISQNGISRLCGPNGNAVDPFDVRSSTDVWLAPNGTIARLVATIPGRSPLLSPTMQNTRNNEEESSRRHSELELRLWKVNVLEWLGNFGLPVKPVEVETWVEVEVSNPFYAKLAPESRRQNEATQLPYHLKRIPWPAKYCFKRTKAAPVTSSSKIDGFDDDPLKFAEDWLAASSFRKEGASSQGSTLPQNQQPKLQDISTPKLDILEGLESLAKIPQYPDSQSASLVYPTPPEGALASVASHMGSSESEFTPRAAVEGPNIKREEHMLSRTRSGSEIVVSSLGPSGLGVGSGLYDTNDDDDLFGEMNERDFGLKGISDADFSFFDEPDFDTLGHGKSDTAQEYHKENLSSFYSPTGNFSFEDRKNSYEQVERVTKNKRESKSLNLSTLNVGQRKKKHVEPEPILLGDARQTVSPPLSPLDIRKILFFELPSFLQHSHSEKTDGVAQHKLTMTKEIRRQGSFEPIFFQRNVFFSDRKYGADGKFFFADRGLLENEGHEVVEIDDPIPTIGFPQRGRRIAASGEPQSSLLGNSSNGRRSASLSSDSSTEDSSDVPSEKIISPTTSTNLKRKRPSLDSDSTTSPLGKLSFSSEIDTTTLQVDSSLFLGSMLSIFSDWSLSGYFSVRQNQLIPVLSRKEDQIQLPQLIVDQITQSSLNHRVDGYSGLPDLEHDTYSPRTFFEDTNIIGDIERLDLKSWVSIQDNFIIPSNESSASRLTTQRRELKGSITKIPPPYLRLHRGRDFLEVLPPAISFWETFGLEPANGVKNVAAYCIHPHNAREAADAFLDRMGLLYSSCSLGKHSRGEKTKLFDSGLGSWHVTPAGESGYRSTMQSLRVLCETLGTNIPS